MLPSNERRSRREVLINGRRVRITDLLEAGLIKPDQDLVYYQFVGQPPHRARITDKGKIHLTDGREYGTPSAAAAAAAKVKAVAGWIAWQTAGDEKTLHELRQRLLTEVAEETSRRTSNQPGQNEAAHFRFEALNKTREEAEAGTPRRLAVRDLLRMWGVDSRERAVVAQIDADLANHGLTTESACRLPRPSTKP